MQIDPRELLQFITDGWGPMNEMCERAGMSERANYDRSKAIMGYSHLPFDVPPPGEGGLLRRGSAATESRCGGLYSKPLNFDSYHNSCDINGNVFPITPCLGTQAARDLCQTGNGPAVCASVHVHDTYREH